MFGIMRSRPWDAVNVVVNAPAESDPWTAPAAPPSDCISATLSTCPKIFFLPWAAQLSATSPMGEDGVIG